MRSLLIITLIILSGSSERRGSQIRTSAGEDNEVVKLIANLPEVKHADFYIRHHGKDRRGLKAYIWGKPTKEKDCYWISVCEFNGMRLVPHFHFYVYRKTHAIKVYAVIANRSVSLHQWRKMDKLKFY